jgi:hypothetical protein
MRKYRCIGSLKWIVALLLISTDVVCAGDFFQIESLKFVNKAPSGVLPVYLEELQTGKEGIRKAVRIFKPYVEASLRTAERTDGREVYARLYFFDKDRKQIGALGEPSPADRGGNGRAPMPVYFEPGKGSKVYFVVPEDLIQSGTKRTGLLVFGDKRAAVARCHPHGSFREYQFAEREQVEKPTYVERKAAMDPLVELKVKTGLPNYPQITLFMCPPVGCTDASDADGVLALCALAKTVSRISRGDCNRPTRWTT